MRSRGGATWASDDGSPPTLSDKPCGCLKVKAGPAPRLPVSWDRLQSTLQVADGIARPRSGSFPGDRGSGRAIQHLAASGGDLVHLVSLICLVCVVRRTRETRQTRASDRLPLKRPSPTQGLHDTAVPRQTTPIGSNTTSSNLFCCSEDVIVLLVMGVCRILFQSTQTHSGWMDVFCLPIGRFIVKRFWTPDILLDLGSSQLLIDNVPPCHFMHASGHQMLDQVVEDDRDHDSWVRGQHD
jgi:hypothetical protein